MTKTPRPQDIAFLTWEERRYRTAKCEYRVMVFEPKGLYPRGTWQVPNGFFHADEEVAFSVVLGEDWRTFDPDAPFSEFDWASPQELRLLASLLLCEVTDGGRIMLYPVVRFGPLLNVADLDLQSPESVERVRRLLLHYAGQRASIRNDFSPLRCIRSKYELVDPTNFAFERRLDFWNALASPNYVLLRGVYALIKSDMLSRHDEFSEEAVISLHIALDASFSLVLRQLRREGVSNPTANDAARWLHQHFDASFDLPCPTPEDKYFGEFYEQRIMTLHPASRFGDVPYSPTMHCDMCHLRPCLRSIFAYLLVGQHDPGYVTAVREHQERYDASTAELESSCKPT